MPPRKSLGGASLLTLTACLATLCAACGGENVLGQQCPSPHTGEATVAPLPDGGPAPRAPVYGTRCAPCEDTEVELDADGCPVFVTFESCAGDICIGGRRISLDPGVDEDAGTDDGGAQ